MVTLSIKRLFAVSLFGIVFVAIYHPFSKKEILGYLTCFLFGIICSALLIEWFVTGICEDMDIDNLVGLVIVVTDYYEKKGTKLYINTDRNAEIKAYADKMNIRCTVTPDGLMF